MPIFRVRFSYNSNEVVYHKTAVVRAPTPDIAKKKVVDHCLAKVDDNLSSFSFFDISVSTYNYIII